MNIIVFLKSTVSVPLGPRPEGYDVTQGAFINAGSRPLADAISARGDVKASKEPVQEDFYPSYMYCILDQFL